MILWNHARQPSFLGRTVKTVDKNKKNSAQTLRGRVCLSKKCAVYTFGNTMQQSGQSDAFPTGLFVFYDAASEDDRPGSVPYAVYSACVLFDCTMK